ncbi:hypothetical protein H8E77_38475 [bacterium]|nr:hypothetical protein [bacterium]
MGQTLTLSLPDEVYAVLKKVSEAEGKAVEAFSTALLSIAILVITDDPLLQLAGTLECDIKDIAERHNDYIGMSLMKEMRGEGDA